MSKLDELIKNLCPDGVEFKKLGEIFNIRNGYTPSKNNPNFWEGGTQFHGLEWTIFAKTEDF